MIDRDFLATLPNTAPRLIAARPGDPLDEQRRIVDRAIARVRRAGVRLPRFEVHWRQKVHDACAGAAERRADGSYAIYLSVDVWPIELERTTYHELRHLADFEAGLTDRGECEARAVHFANTLMNGETWTEDEPASRVHAYNEDGSAEDNDTHASRPRSEPRPEMPYTSFGGGWSRGRVYQTAALHGFPSRRLGRLQKVHGATTWHKAVFTWSTRDVNKLLHSLLFEDSPYAHG